MKTNNITAVVVQDSIANGVRITTLELEYPRFIHAEVLTHRQFSRNSASSRAVPVDDMLQLVSANPAEPVFWGKAQQGMQAREEVDDSQVAITYWNAARYSALDYAETLKGLGLHKQIVNRITEPFQMIRVVVTATEFDNFFQLRDHADAQPEIQALAKAMGKAFLESKPMQLHAGDWHVPYVTRHQDAAGQVFYGDDTVLDRASARLISASCCAQVSYRLQNKSLEKAAGIAKRLIQARPWHASPFEHQATPMRSGSWLDIEPGVTHMDTLNQLWSANFKKWIQHRQLLEQAAIQ
jgi:thymidylate synthase ThyX